MLDLINDYRGANHQACAERDSYARDLAATRAELEAARHERDLAIAHDRQPYPTAAAYEATCRALEAAHGERDEARDTARGLRQELRHWRTYGVEARPVLAAAEALYLVQDRTSVTVLDELLNAIHAWRDKQTARADKE
jgi:hypothetical protein